MMVNGLPLIKIMSTQQTMLFCLKDFANKIINNFPNAFNFSEYIQNKSNKPIRFFEYIRRRYSEVSFDKPLPLLSTKMDTVNQLQEYLEENTKL